MHTDALRRLSILSHQLVSREVDGDTRLLLNSCKSSHAATASKLVTPEDAAKLVPDDCWITTSGFVGSGCPELLLNALRARHDATGFPTKLKLIVAATAGDKKGRGTDQLAKPGLLTEIIYGWMGTAPGLMSMVEKQQLLAWNIPLGVGTVTRIGLGTFVDPRQSGGAANKLTASQAPPRVELVELPGSKEEALWYHPPAGGVRMALLRGTVADHAGNISCEEEALLGDGLCQAAAAKNWRQEGAAAGQQQEQQAAAAGGSGRGLVIVQVCRVLPKGQLLPPGRVTIPGALVDYIVLAPPPLHQQTFADPAADLALTSSYTHAAQPSQQQAAQQKLPTIRRIISHRAMMAISGPNMLVNLGVGLPEGVAELILSHGHQNPVARSAVLSTEAGLFGGMPQGGLRFGSSSGHSAMVMMSNMIDLYNGGGIDVAFLGMAQADQLGNVNVSRFGSGRAPGCGGFIDISQTSRAVVYMGTFTSGGLKVQVRDGQLHILQEGRTQKLVPQVLECTFNGPRSAGKDVLYVTERAVFRLMAQGGVELLEVAPGIDLQKQVLDLMGFMPYIAQGGPKLMDARMFAG